MTIMGKHPKVTHQMPEVVDALDRIGADYHYHHSRLGWTIVISAKWEHIFVYHFDDDPGYFVSVTLKDYENASIEDILALIEHYNQDDLTACYTTEPKLSLNS